MTDLEELKKVIVDTIRDEEVVSSLCSAIDSYVRRWPFVLLVHDWDIWNESKRALRLQVIRWLEQKGERYDFWQFRDGSGLIGFESLKSATHFTLRWSGQSPVMAGTPAHAWNPHPLNSTFEASSIEEVAPAAVTYTPISRNAGRSRARYCGNKFARGYGMKA
jgi:hypothetical protein